MHIVIYSKGGALFQPPTDKMHEGKLGHFNTNTLVSLLFQLLLFYLSDGYPGVVNY